MSSRDDGEAQRERPSHYPGMTASAQASAKEHEQQSIPSYAAGLQPIEEVAQNYSNDPSAVAYQWQPPPGTAQEYEPRLEMARAQDDGEHYIFRAPVVLTGKDWCELAGSVYLRLSLVRQRRTHLKRGDLVTGRMVPNGMVMEPDDMPGGTVQG